MSGEPHKLVAKIQHFYDVMIQVADEAEYENIVGSKEKNKNEFFENSHEIRKLISEYGKVFEDFLYKETV